MKEIKESFKQAKKALIRLNTNENESSSIGIRIDSKNPIYELSKLTPFSEMEYII